MNDGRRRKPRNFDRSNPDNLKPLVNRKNALVNNEYWGCYLGPTSKFGIRFTHHHYVWDGHKWVYIDFKCIESSLDAASSTSKRKCRPRRIF